MTASCPRPSALAAALLVVAIALPLAGQSPPALAPGGSLAPAQTHDVEAIRERLSALGPSQPLPLFQTPPSLRSPFAPGRANPAVLTYGLERLRFYRWLAGLSDNVVLDADWVDQAQYGAALLAVAGQGLTHTPSYPAALGLPRAFYDRGYAATSSSNLHQGDADLAQALTGFMSDSDDRNIDRLGHRRWVLAPKLDRVGFGLAGEFVDLKVFDAASAGGESVSAVTWPGTGPQPLGWFAPRDAWSLSLNPEAFARGLVAPKAGLKVTLRRARDGRVWQWDASHRSGYFALETSGFGLPWCLIFRPDGLLALRDGDRFDVSVEGVRDGTGKALPLSWSTVFFEPGPAIVPLVESTHPRSLVVHADAHSVGARGNPTAIEGGQATLGYVGPRLKDFVWYVDGPEGILPVALEVNGDGVLHAPGERVTAPEGGFTSLRLVGSVPGVQCSLYARGEWTSWFRSGETARFADGRPVETVSFLIE